MPDTTNNPTDANPYIPITTEEAIQAVRNGAWLFRAEIPDFRALLEGIADAKDGEGRPMPIHLTNCRINSCWCVGLTINNPVFAIAAPSSQLRRTSLLFTCYANFYEAEFKERVSFTEARFKDEASFMRAIFYETAYFESATFDGGANFVGSEFQQVANFQHAQFGTKASPLPVHFSSASFKARAEFGNARFSGEVTFEGTRFEDDVEFNGIHFTGCPRFRRQNSRGPFPFSELLLTE